MKLFHVAIIAMWIIALPYIAAQTAAAVSRPATPSATTLSAPASQIAAWYRYAMYLEAKLAEQAPAPAPQLVSVQAILDQLTALSARPGVSISVQNSKVTLTATADGTKPISFQWVKDGVDIPGATGSSIPVPTGTAAAYSVRATNAAGNATSQTIAVTAP